MKGLKTLTRVAGWRSRCWRAPTPASASAAAYKHYVACGVSQNAKPAHMCRSQRKKGAFFRSNKADVYYTRLRQVPDRQKPLRRKAGSGRRARSTSTRSPRTSPASTASAGSSKASGSAPSPSRSPAEPDARWWSSASTRRPRTPPSARCAAARFSYEALLGLSADGSPRHTTALLGEVERGGRGRRRLGAGWSGSRSASGRGRSPGCGSGSPPRGRWRPAPGCR